MKGSEARLSCSDRVACGGPRAGQVTTVHRGKAVTAEKDSATLSRTRKHGGSCLASRGPDLGSGLDQITGFDIEVVYKPGKQDVAATQARVSGASWRRARRVSGGRSRKAKVPEETGTSGTASAATSERYGSGVVRGAAALRTEMGEIWQLYSDVGSTRRKIFFHRRELRRDEGCVSRTKFKKGNPGAASRPRASRSPGYLQETDRGTETVWWLEIDHATPRRPSSRALSLGGEGFGFGELGSLHP